jgi:signal transduction histidine kinase
MVTPGWVVVLRPDATIEAVAGGAPPVWIGRDAWSAFEAYPALARALPALVDARVGETAIHRLVVEPPGDDEGRRVELLLVEAVPVRRALIPLEPLVLRALDPLMSQAERAGVALSARFGQHLPSVALVDGEKIAWALSTLVGGALRHLSTGTPRGEPRVVVACEWDGSNDEIVLDVSDNGPGIPKARARWLFDRDPETGRPAGLALLMVKDVLVAHGGSISVESEVARGTSFTLRFPRRPIGPPDRAEGA